jgi:hypothetical protein
VKDGDAGSVPGRQEWRGVENEGDDRYIIDVEA